MKILITGINGFVGSNLTRALRETPLQQNQEIYGLDIASPQKDGVVKTFSWDDLNFPSFKNLESFPSFDAIIHLAGKAHDTKNKADAQEYFDVNVGLTKKIFDYFVQSEATKFIFFSSVKAAANTVDGEILTENVAPKPVGPYGESKLQAEEYISSSLPLSCGEGVGGRGAYILRPAMIHGPGNKGNFNLLYSAVKHGFRYQLGIFDNLRSFASIENVIFIIKQILESDIPSGIYNIADDEPVSTNQLIAWIASSLGKKTKRLNISQLYIKYLAKAGSILHLPINTERLEKLSENYIVSNSKIKSALGISKLPVDAQTGFIHTLYSLKT